MTTAADSWLTQLAARTAEEICARSVQDTLPEITPVCSANATFKTSQYLLAATTSAEWARRTRGSELFDTAPIGAGELRERYVDWWTFWERDGYPAATMVPASLATRAVCQTPFRIGAELWELRVASVEVDTAERIGWEPFLQTRTVEASTPDQTRVES